jgi:SWI/SNF-related matrix-associated actin-dependent regulator of chromatin subfamily A member 5
LTCFEGPDAGHMVECRSCPRGFHYDCLEPQYQAKVKGFAGFFCSQHMCCDCGKSTSDAGGLIFRCRWCPQGFCEDCLDWDKAELIGDNLPEFELLGEAPTAGGFYVKCPSCVILCEENEEQQAWTEGKEESYKEQHDRWIADREEAQRQLEARDAGPKIEDDDLPSPPALTDTSLPTPALAGSRVSTPKLEPQSKAKRPLSGEFVGETRYEKKARLDAQVWTVGSDPLMRAFE